MVSQLASPSAAATALTANDAAPALAKLYESVVPEYLASLPNEKMAETTPTLPLIDTPLTAPKVCTTALAAAEAAIRLA